MKQKLWIKLRVFLSFSIFIILIINIFSCILYFSTIQAFRNDLENDIQNQVKIIKSFIDLDKNSFISLPNKQIEEINELWFFFYIWKDNNQSKYLEWINLYENELIFKELYHNYTIIVWKDIKDLNTLKQNFIDITILLNILALFFTLITTYIITKQVLKPLSKLTEYFTSFDIYKSQNLIEQDYKWEIWKLTETINKFTKDIKNIFDWQKDFIQDTSHELKTPLMQIETNLDLLEEAKIWEKEKSRINQIRTSINNINEIISNISFILRWDEKILKNEKIDLQKYFKEIIKKYEKLAKTKNIKINLICKTNCELTTNTYYIDRLFWNIISNAIFYNNWNNEIQILIEKNTVKITDNGIWIKKEDLNKIFNRFYRSNNSKIYSRDWSWLWLSIVKKICDMFEWTVKVKSEEGKGSEIFVEFQQNSYNKKL